MRSRAHRPNGESPCRIEVKAMSHKRDSKRTEKKQRHSILPWIDKVVAALYWFVKLVLMLIDWFNK